MTETEIKAIMSQLNIIPIAKHLGIHDSARRRGINTRLRTLFSKSGFSDELPEFVAYIRVLAQNLKLFADYLENTKK